MNVESSNGIEVGVTDNVGSKKNISDDVSGKSDRINERDVNEGEASSATDATCVVKVNIEVRKSVTSG